MSECLFCRIIARQSPADITYEDDAHRPVKEEQYHGTIIRLSLEEGIVIQTASGTEKALPPDLRSVLGTRSGPYRLRSTGEVITDAELQSTWIQALS